MVPITKFDRIALMILVLVLLAVIVIKQPTLAMDALKRAFDGLVMISHS